MKLIHRLNKYIELKRIGSSEFEKTCGISNGYFGKQLKASGSVGSHILEKIKKGYPDLNLNWLITGDGPMLVKAGDYEKGDEAAEQLLREEQVLYQAKEKIVAALKQQIEVLNSIPEKRKPRRRKS